MNDTDDLDLDDSQRWARNRGEADSGEPADIGAIGTPQRDVPERLFEAGVWAEDTGGFRAPASPDEPARDKGKERAVGGPSGEVDDANLTEDQRLEATIESLRRASGSYASSSTYRPWVYDRTEIREAQPLLDSSRTQRAEAEPENGPRGRGNSLTSNDNLPRPATPNLNPAPPPAVDPALAQLRRQRLFRQAEEANAPGVPLLDRIAPARRAAAPRRVEPPVAEPARDVPAIPFNFNVQLEVGADGVAAEVQAQGDINAFLELVGVQGPIDGLLHNAALAVLVIVVVIGAGVWAPYITGRLLVRLVTDLYVPAVGSFVGLLTSWLQRFTDPILDPIVDGLLLVAASMGFVNASVTTNDIAVNVSAALAVPLDSPLTVNESSPLGVDTLAAAVNGSFGSESGNQTMSFTRKVILSLFQGGDERLMFGVSERVVFIVIGYIVNSFILYHHARRTGRLNHPYVQTLKRLSIQWMGHLATAVKFSFFIAIELGFFPTFCGVLIDLCTLPVFGPRATVASRLAFYHAFPWTSWFLHWLTGTSFMFQFAIYISTVRKIVRPGVVWFVRDPDDPDFHPMQEIVERPTLLQLRKLAFGALMYAIIIVFNVGGVVLGVQLLSMALNAQSGPAKIWPLKWDFTAPLSEFPIELLIFHFVLPFAFGWTRPRTLFRQLLAAWFRVTARRLRLTHFMFGNRLVDEESDDEGEEDEPVVHRAFADLQRETAATAARAGPAEDGGAAADGGDDGAGRRRRREFRYMRVPNHDHIEVIAGQRMLQPMRRGEPVVGRAHENEDDVRANWTRVYVPDRFRLRVAGVIVSQWLFVVAFFTFAVAAP
ncbi:hypothetical protein HK405_007696, partial [Cladochytrium tenue]